MYQLLTTSQHLSLPLSFKLSASTSVMTRDFFADLSFCPFSPSACSQPGGEYDPVKMKVSSHFAQCPYLRGLIGDGFSLLSDFSS